MTQRQDRYLNLMELAEVIAKRSHDSETQVGALLVSNKTGAILASGYNGFVRGADDNSLPNTRPDKYKFIIHAEMNLLCNCARHGISTDDCFVVCTLSPCVNCMRALYQAGISRVVVRKKYHDFSELLKMGDLSIVERIIPETSLIELNYNNEKS
jgi:dCMP deaminase